MAFHRIPRRFYDDHVERDLPAPPLVVGLPCMNGAVIDDQDENFEELVNDARYYADPNGPDAAPPGLKHAARSLLKALGL